MRKTAIIFDHDGTLVDSIEAVIICTNLILVKNGYRKHSADEILKGFPYPTEERFQYHTGTTASSVSAKMAEDFYSEMHTIGIDYLKVYPGISAALDLLVDYGYSMGMVSNNQGIFIRKAAAKLQYSYDLEIILGEENVKANKPSPDGLLQACAGLAARPENCWYIGDTISDHEAAHAAKMKSGLVTWGVQTEAVLSASGADALFRTPADMADYFKPA
ncbi:MAG: HAD family hydrolase [Spirochaetales bacterium]|nr:HAD family hydrolase [Spirochaetales bacterium]